jgi:molybdopterin/thiamine biosynthesis adenylyltransferase/rhodanese-related sulfurtransferase
VSTQPKDIAIPEIDPRDAVARQRAHALLIDVREDDERAAGWPSGAVGLARGEIPARIAEIVRDTQQEILTICGSGKRSLLAAQTLRELGYAQVASVRGGFARWKSEGLPIEEGALDRDSAERYARHLVLPEVGVAGQKKLADARVTLIGAGGLGSPAAFYLAAAGVGFLRLVDDDAVDRSNLQRQILHTDAGIGTAKVASAQQRLSALNPRVDIDAVRARITADNVESLVKDVDVVIDGADNCPTRYLLSDACVQLGKPLVYGAVHRFVGQVSVFDAGRQRGIAPCYRCLFPEPPRAEDAPNCAEAGVLGVLPGIIGLLQATEALKLILEIGRSLSGRLLQFDALQLRFHEIRLTPDPDCAVCAPGTTFPGYQQLQEVCRGH